MKSLKRKMTMRQENYYLQRQQQPQPAGAVAAQIMECLARAQARIPNLLGQAMFETIGPNVPAAEPAR